MIFFKVYFAHQVVGVVCRRFASSSLPVLRRGLGLGLGLIPSLLLLPLLECVLKYASRSPLVRWARGDACRGLLLSLLGEFSALWLLLMRGLWLAASLSFLWQRGLGSGEPSGLCDDTPLVVSVLLYSVKSRKLNLCVGVKGV